MAGNRFPHILLLDWPEYNTFTSTKSSRDNKRIPDRERQSHSAFVKQQLETAWREAEHEQVVYHVNRKGIYIEFKGEKGFDLITKSLESRMSRDQDSWIKLLNIRTEKSAGGPIENEESETLETTYATVFVPHNKKNFFFDRVEKYATEIDQRSDKPKNYTLINSISDLRKALDVDSFWQDDRSLIPDDTPQWCEIWLSSDADEAISRFDDLLRRLQLSTKTGIIRFPERVVKVVLANKEQFIKRINKAAREEEEGHPGTQSASDHWKIGQARDRGSIHSDIWQGMASELAESNIIAISPRIGWWRERAHLEKWNRRTRYSLIVSITTPEEHIDVYTPVANKVGITVPVEITT